MLGLVPTAPANVLPVIVAQMPHKLRDRNTQCLYLSALFRIAEDKAGAPIREALLTAAVEHLLSLDVEIRWEDIVDVPTGEDAGGVGGVREWLWVQRGRGGGATEREGLCVSAGRNACLRHEGGLENGRREETGMPAGKRCCDCEGLGNNRQLGLDSNLGKAIWAYSPLGLGEPTKCGTAPVISLPVEAQGPQVCACAHAPKRLCPLGLQPAVARHLPTPPRWLALALSAGCYRGTAVIGCEAEASLSIQRSPSGFANLLPSPHTLSTLCCYAGMQWGTIWGNNPQTPVTALPLWDWRLQHNVVV